MTAVIIIVSILAVFGTVFLTMWFVSRSRLREAKNIERGLKMVPMLIHLPPISDDIDVGARDQRDIADENISKAQILYDIIASTARNGFRSKFYGQRHITFEIVASRGRVHYYTAVPVALVDVVQQAIVSAYPAARLEEVAEHNIFSPVGKISGTIGGELNLKDDYFQPIATFQETKRDSMSSLLNALSTLNSEDGAGIQFLLRPANKGWEKAAHSYVAKTRKNKGNKSGVGLGAKDFASAIWKPPKGTDEVKPEEKQLTNLEQSHLDSIEEKTRHTAYEVLIRVVASSNTAHKSQTILNNIVATFALFDSAGKNGFKFAPAQDIESFATAYIMRMFPPEANGNILNSVELATLFHFPDESNIPTSQLERQSSKQVDGPRNMPSDGLLLGYNIFRGVKKEVRLSDDDRRRHMYVVGQTGTGKSVFLKNLALQDMLNGKGFCFVDPHGDAVEDILSMVPKERTEDIVLFSPGETDYPMGLNLFEYDRDFPEQKDFLVQEAIDMLYKLYDPQHQGIIGPRYEHWFRNASLTVMADPEGGTFIDIPKVFTDDAFMKQKLKHVTDQAVLDFWNKEMAQTSDYHKSEVLGWFVSKFGAFMNNEMMRNTIGQTKSSFDFREIMDNKKILLVNLSKGKTGELNSKLLGMIFVMKFQAAAMSRANIDESQRVDFSLYVDEFQNFSTDSFATILSEARKYRLNLIVANQYISQLTDEIREAVFGNVGSLVSLRAGTNDADVLVKQFAPAFDAEDIIKLPNANAIVRLMIGGVPTEPFSMAPIPPLGHTNFELQEALKKLSAAKYGRPKAVVDEEIKKRLASPPAPARPKPGRAPSPGTFKQPGAKGGAGGSSFLDEWLAKRKAAGNTPGGAKPGKAMQKPAAVATPPGAAASKPVSKTTPIKQEEPARSKPEQEKKPASDQDNALHVSKGGDGVSVDIPNEGEKQRPQESPAGFSEQPKSVNQEQKTSLSTAKDDTGLPYLDSHKVSNDKPAEGDSGSKLQSQQPESPSNSTKEASAPKQETANELVHEDEDIYIDKDGNIHLKRDK